MKHFLESKEQQKQCLSFGSNNIPLFVKNWIKLIDSSGHENSDGLVSEINVINQWLCRGIDPFTAHYSTGLVAPL